MTREELDNYYLLEDAIRSCNNRLLEMKTAMYRSPRFDGVGSSPSHRNRIEDMYINRIEKYVKIVAEKKEYERLKARVELYIDSIGDMLTRRIYEKRFFEKKEWSTIADELGGGNTFDSVRVACSRYLKNHPDG